jgi:myo-inositol 2-dehydrogenase / D-chiro-inositol 1-dehydrogenase
MADKRYRIGLVGCGDIAETGHVPAILTHPRFALAAVCDVRRERAELLAKMAGGVPIVADHRALIARSDVDAVILALHPEISVDIAIDVLRASKPVLDEKPLARSMEDGLRLAREVEATGGVYQIGFVFRYCDLVQRLAAYSKRIGTPSFMRMCVYDEINDPVGNPEHFRRIQGILTHSSAITHEGSHPIDYSQYLNPGQLLRVSACATTTDPQFKGPNLWNARFELKDGSLLVIDIGWFLPKLPPSTVTIVGPGGAVSVDARTGEGRADFRDGSAVIAGLPLTQDWKRQLDTFAEAIDRGRAEVATVYDGLRALAATIACERSRHEGTTVDVAIYGRAASG